MNCSRCGVNLVPDRAFPDTDYQFNNCLWIGLFGGYGMFVDNIEARLPINTEDRWLRHPDGEYMTFEDERGVHPIEDPEWEPEYREERILPGQPDYEAVLCHECAHYLCAAEPWLDKLLNPYGSHAHRTAWKEANPDHFGWDYEG